MEKVPMTIAGFESLKEELRRRQQEERPRIVEAISEARAHGDLSENAEYHSAKEAQSLNEGRISELEDLTARAEVIDVSKLSGDKVKFGATVKLVDEDTEEEKVYQIVGDQEADVKQGRISVSSPIARALIGKGEGDTVEVAAPAARAPTRSWSCAGSDRRRTMSEARARTWSLPDFLLWEQKQERRYELVEGQAVLMAAGHRRMRSSPPTSYTVCAPSPRIAVPRQRLGPAHPHREDR